MVIMSMSDEVIPEETKNDSTSGASWYILDETGDTLLDILPKNVSVPQDLSSTFEDETVDLCHTADSKGELSTTFEDANEVLSTVENQEDSSCAFEDAKEVFSSTLQNEDSLLTTASGSEMFRLKSVPSNRTPKSALGNKRKLNKRKRKSDTTMSKQNNTTPSLGSGKGLNRTKKRKKSVVVIDSDSEHDASVIEIEDETQSIIVLSDDEVGVCSGSMTKPRAVKPNNANNAKKPNPVVVEDLTGKYLPKKGESSSQQVPSSENIKKNVELYQPMANQSEKRTGLRPIVIDGCNVAFGHGRDRFSSLGLKICVDYFKKLGHEVRVFIPQFRKHHNATTDPQLLDEMEKEGTLCYTPSRRTDGKMIVSYDDRFIVQYADANGGVIVSKDNYRDLLNENPEWKETINKRLLMYTWVGDTIMFPKDPLGRHGPNLQEFLNF